MAGNNLKQWTLILQLNSWPEASAMDPYFGFHSMALTQNFSAILEALESSQKKRN